MRRKDREVTGRADILQIMDDCEVVSLALTDEDWPYVVELNFGYLERDGKLALYFHGAYEGTKIELIRKNPNAAFAMSCDHLYVPGSTGCSATYRFSSVCGRGKITVIDGPEKLEALAALMAHYEKDKIYAFEDKHAASTCVMKLDVEFVSGKRKVIM
jgi:nitroimidazol reductase NimA-like FMN-containing flavoprotein (pyridoxamine 5'-phosphate oxidase superfamily)